MLKRSLREGQQVGLNETPGESRLFLRQLPDLLVPEASDQMVIDQACGLHVGIYYSATEEFEAFLFEILCEAIGNWRGGRHL